MREFEKALADIGEIRLQLASGTLFRGFGPAVVAGSGVLAILTAAAQSVLPELAQDHLWFLGTWVVTAVVSGALIGTEMLARTRRHHGGLADDMLITAAEHFLPAAAAGAAIGGVVVRFAPQAAWMLPGLWAMLVSIGLFASVRFLPRIIGVAGVWYFLAGMTALIVGSRTAALSPWLMGVPFGAGQILLAALLYSAFGGDDAEV